MPTLSDLFDQALRHHQSGQLAQAENLYRQVLQADPRHADAWHFLGIVAGQLGQPALAVEHIRRCLRYKPDIAAAHYNLGNALRDLDKLEEAKSCYREALRLKPDYVQAHNNLGLCFRDLGKLEEAEVCYRAALRLKPDFAEALGNLGLALQEQGRLEEAEASCRAALRLKPGDAKTHVNLGVALKEQGRLEEAKACFREALRFKPDFSTALNNIGNVLREQGHVEEAEVCYREALRLQPSDVEAHSNLGIVLSDLGKLEDGDACFREAIRLRPDYIEAHNNLGFNLLRQGKFADGWPEYERRRLIKDNLRYALPPPTWDGSALDGRTILLQAEQGFGDSFQFIRYARLVKATGGRVLVQCPFDLARILAGCAGIDQLLPTGTPLPAYHVMAPFMSLPMLCGTTVGNIPAAVPYLAAEPARVDRWRVRLKAIPGFKVGICWQGNSLMKSDRLRSVPLAFFAPLAAVPGVSLIAVQRGPGLEQIAQQSEHLQVIDLPGRSQDPAEGWLDTAALIQALDLVVSTDTGVVHLAGALGAPVWVAIRFMPDWRWLLNRDDSPWYPTMRLFRQRQPGDWAEVFQRIAEDLRGLLRTAPPK